MIPANECQVVVEKLSKPKRGVAAARLIQIRVPIGSVLVRSMITTPFVMRVRTYALLNRTRESQLRAHAIPGCCSWHSSGVPKKPLRILELLKLPQRYMRLRTSHALDTRLGFQNNLTSPRQGAKTP